MAHPLFAAHSTLSPLSSSSTGSIRSTSSNNRVDRQERIADTPTFQTIPEYPNTPIPDEGSRTEVTTEALQQPFTQLEDTSRQLQSFFIVALIALVGWVIVQTLFSLSPFGKAQPFAVLAIEFVWWLSLLALLALIFKGVLRKLSFSTLSLKLVKKQLDIAHQEIMQKNALLEQSIKDVWAARKRFSLPANVVSPGHYQIQDLFGGYRDVRVQNELGGHKLVCDCYVYRKDGICTHTIAASSLHLRVFSIMRHQGRSSTKMKSGEQPTKDTRENKSAMHGERQAG